LQPSNFQADYSHPAVNGTDSEAFKTKKAEAPKVSAEEARKRFERLVNSDSQNPSKGL